MKWELSKGHEGDFSGAPKWATLVVKSREHGRLSWEESSYPIKGKRYQWIYDGIEEKYEVTDETIRFNIIAERRPITEPDVNQQLTTEWGGEGLPPVGVECELKSEEYADFDWVKVKVVFEHNGELVVIVNMPDQCIHDRMSKHSSGYDGAKFRPIRSPENVARDELKTVLTSAFGNLHHGSADGVEVDYIAGKLFEAGYRKVE